MPNIMGHVAPGLGDLLPGWAVVPQNPITAAAYGTTYVPGIGDLLPGSYPLPQNPIKDYVTGQVRMLGQSKKGVSGCGCGCGGSGSCGQINGQSVGMGDFSNDWSTFKADLSAGSVMAALNQTIMGVPAWALLAGTGLFLYMYVFGGPGSNRYQRHRAASRAYRSAYAA